jgi:hypothetical protein
MSIFGGVEHLRGVVSAGQNVTLGVGSCSGAGQCVVEEEFAHARE